MYFFGFLYGSCTGKFHLFHCSVLGVGCVLKGKWKNMFINRIMVSLAVSGNESISGFAL